MATRVTMIRRSSVMPKQNKVDDLLPRIRVICRSRFTFVCGRLVLVCKETLYSVSLAV